jgi:predicted HicB family RNase H-like nuclease
MIQTTIRTRRVRVKMTMTPAEVLKRPYARTVMPESDGTFRAEIIEFPGCIAVGDTAVEALERLEDVAVSWLAVALLKKQPIPAPTENAEGFSGKLILRIPKSLHKKAAHMAVRDGVSLNQFILSGLAEQVGGRTVAANIRQRFAAVLSYSFNIASAAKPIDRTTTALPTLTTGTVPVALLGLPNA